MVVKPVTLALALGLAIVGAAFPSFAESNRANNRAQAIQECSAEAAKYSEHTWGVSEVTTYRSCMAQHGQRE
jgi:hypothetical protein